MADAKIQNERISCIIITFLAQCQAHLINIYWLWNKPLLYSWALERWKKWEKDYYIYNTQNHKAKSKSLSKLKGTKDHSDQFLFFRKFFFRQKMLSNVMCWQVLRGDSFLNKNKIHLQIKMSVFTSKMSMSPTFLRLIKYFLHKS